MREYVRKIMNPLEMSGFQEGTFRPQCVLGGRYGSQHLGQRSYPFVPEETTYLHPFLLRLCRKYRIFFPHSQYFFIVILPVL